MSVQHNLEVLRIRIAEIEDLCEDQETLPTRVRSVEECIAVHHVREFMHRVITIEGRIGVSGGVIGETLRECQTRLDRCVAGIVNLDTRMRSQELTHELSERESREETHQSVDGRPRTRRTAQQHRVAARARAFNGVPLREAGPWVDQGPPTMEARVFFLRELESWIRQLRQDVETQGLDEAAIHQRTTRFMTEHQRGEGGEANNRGNLETRFDQTRREFQEAMTEHALSVQRVTHELNHRGQRIEQLHRMVHTEVMCWIESFQPRFSQTGELMTRVATETDRRSHQMDASVGQIIDEQQDIRQMVEDLA